MVIYNINKMQFLKLTNFIINIRNVSYIEKTTDKYYIVLNKVPFIDGFLMFGSGGIGSTSKTITVHNDGKTNDYESVKRWIEKCE